MTSPAYPALPLQVLLPADSPDGSGSLLGCVVEARVLSASRWSVKGEVLRVLYRPPPLDAQVAPAHSAAGGGSSGSGGEGQAAAGPHKQQQQTAAASSRGSRVAGQGESCACMSGDAPPAPAQPLSRQQAAAAPAAAPAAANSQGTRRSQVTSPRPQQVVSPARSSQSSEGQPAVEQQVSQVSVMSDSSAVFPLARAEASQEHMAAANAAGFGAPPKRALASNGGAGEVLLLLALLAGLLGMLVSGLLAMQP